MGVKINQKSFLCGSHSKEEDSELNTRIYVNEQLEPH
jgi:Zn ribbon nucleic-acid-binding protein